MPTRTALQTLTRGGRTVHAVADLPRDLLVRLAECPELPLRMGPAETIKAGGSSLVVRAELPIGGRRVSVAYKKARRKTWIKRLTQLLGRNRTLRSFRAGHRLLELGVATARPLAVVVPGRFDGASPTYLAAEWLEGTEDAAAFGRRCLKLSPRERQRRSAAAAEAVGTLLGRMHAGGVAHRDLRAENLMVRHVPATGRVDAFLIDLDGISFRRSLDDRLRWKNLSRLGICLDGWRAFGPGTRQRFLWAYLAAAGGRIDRKAASERLTAATADRQARRAA